MPRNSSADTTGRKRAAEGSIEAAGPSAGAEISVSLAAVNLLKALKHNIGDLTAEVAAKVICAGSDFALIVDRSGVIKDLSLTNEDLKNKDFASWIGRHWIETVTVESRPKIKDRKSTRLNSSHSS